MKIRDSYCADAPVDFECGSLYVKHGDDTVCMYCRVGHELYMLVTLERGNWWTHDMSTIDRAEWVDVTELYELRRVANDKKGVVI